MLIQAASAYFYAGKPGRARDLFEQAAATGEQQRDVDVAGDAYYSLYVMAAQERKREQARQILDRMVLLAAAPDVTDAQRTTILKRISIQLPSFTNTGSR